MIALDSNVLLRLLTVDDEGQTRRAAATITRAEATGEAILLNDVVIAEAMWTMAKRYKAPRSLLLEIARGILDTPSFAFERRSQVEEAVRLFEQSAADFSDCLIVARSSAFGCSTTLTFDVECSKLPGAHAV